MFRPQRPQKHTHTSDKLFLQESDIGRGRSGTLGDVSTLGGTWPGLRRRHGRKDSTSKEDASTALGPSRPGSPQGLRPEPKPQLAAP
jgi:hypothetical protein